LHLLSWAVAASYISAGSPIFITVTSADKLPVSALKTPLGIPVFPPMPLDVGFQGHDMAGYRMASRFLCSCCVSTAILAGIASAFAQRVAVDDLLNPLDVLAHRDVSEKPGAEINAVGDEDQKPQKQPGAADQANRFERPDLDLNSGDSGYRIFSRIAAS
jgi:hypothetical protein